MVLQNRDVLVFAAAGEQDVGDLAAGDVAGMEDAAGGMAAFAAEIKLVRLLRRDIRMDFAHGREFQAEFFQFADAGGAAGDDVADGVRMAEARSGGQRVGNMRFERVVFVDDAGDAALRVARVAFFGLRLRDDDDFAVLGGLQGGRQAGQTRTDDKVSAMNAFLRCFRHGYRFPQGMFFCFFNRVNC